jgi:hypothetical protein
MASSRTLGVLLLCLGGVARADEPASLPAPATEPASAPAAETETETEADLGDPSFRPIVEVERIVVTGNDRTNEKLVRRALLVAEGDRLRTGDPRFRASRYHVLALGFFRDAQLRLDKGSRRGAVVLTVHVVERETLVLNRLDLGTSEETAVWFGLDIGTTNLLGTGVGLSVAGVYATAPRLPGGTPQFGFRLRVADQSLLGTPLGAHGTLLYNDASEADAGRAFGYRRVGGSGGLSWDLSRAFYISADARVEWVHTGAEPPPEIEAGDSRVVTLAAGLDVDTRNDPILPSVGDHFALVVQAGGEPIGGSYDYLRLRARWERWLEIAPRHIMSLHVDGGFIAGSAPRFDRFYIGDLNPLLTDRKLDLVVSTRAAPDIFGTGADEVRYGDLETGVTFEYAYQLFRGRRTIYGGDLFVATGIIGLGGTSDLRMDLALNGGLRLDTALGVVEVSLSNVFGRVPP